MYPSVVLEKVDVHRFCDLSTKCGANDPSTVGNKTSAILTGLVESEECYEESLIKEPCVRVARVDHAVNFPF